MKRKWLRRCAGGTVVLAVVAVGATALSYSRGAPPVDWTDRLAAIDLAVPFRTWEEHGRLYPKGDDTYVLQIDSDVGGLRYFGSKHTRDRRHPQREQIETLWQDFQPTVALHEGRSRGFLIGPIYERLLGLTEPALVHTLARRDGIPLYSLEPAYDREVGELLKRWSREQVALYFTLRVYWSEAQGRANDALAADLLAKRTDTPALSGSLASVADMDRVWNRDFSDHGEWRTLKKEPPSTYLHQISDDSRIIRGQHMVRALVDLVRQGERVFAVVGCSHVIRQEPTIRDLLKTPP